MALRPLTDTDNLTLVLSVQNDGSVAAMTRDLNDALTLVRESLDDPDIYFVTIDVSGTWRPGDVQLDPWETHFQSAWQSLLDTPGMREPLAAWLGRVTDLLREKNKEQISCISEHDEAQFAEVPAALLATADKRYLPLYTELMKVWDLDHAVSQFYVTEQLIELHGKTPETDALAAVAQDWM